jgi:lysophospholipase L1-like esterase
MAKALTIVAFGDSITQAKEVAPEKKWPELLRAALQARMAEREVSVVNAGVGGNTSREGLARIEQDVLSRRSDWVLVEFGGNDATHIPDRHVPPDEFAANLTRIERLIMEKTMARVMLLTFPPVVDAWHASGKLAFHTSRGGLDAHVDRYRCLTREHAGRRGLPLADIDAALRRLMRRDGPEKYIRPDGVHLTEEGNAAVAEEVLAVLQNGE